MRLPATGRTRVLGDGVVGLLREEDVARDCEQNYDAQDDCSLTATDEDEGATATGPTTTTASTGCGKEVGSLDDGGVGSGLGQKCLQHLKTLFTRGIYRFRVVLLGLNQVYYIIFCVILPSCRLIIAAPLLQ